MGTAYKYLLGNLVHENTTNVPTGFMPKKSVRIKCKNSNVFFRKRKRVYLCFGAHQESPQ